MEAGLDRTTVSIWLTDASGQVTFVNRNWIEFTGDPAETDFGDQWQRRAYPEDLNAFIVDLQQAVADRRPISLHGRFRRRDGEFRWLHVAGLPRFLPDGTFSGHAGAAIDVTDLGEQRDTFAFTAQELQLLMRVAEEVSAIDTALKGSETRLREISAHAERVREEERRALARMLHDDVGQLFVSLRMEIAAAINVYRAAPASPPPELVDRLQAAAGLLDLGTTSLKQLSAALRPPILDHLGLVDAIRWEAATFAKRTGIRCRVAAQRGLEVGDGVAATLYKILLEALTNVARHADAGAVSICIRANATTAFLHVRDNGRGITRQQIASLKTMGLLGMRERARAAWGELRIGRHRKGGTRLVAAVPLESPAKGRDA